MDLLQTSPECDSVREGAHTRERHESIRHFVNLYRKLAIQVIIARPTDVRSNRDVELVAAIRSPSLKDKPVGEAGLARIVRIGATVVTIRHRVSVAVDEGVAVQIVAVYKPVTVVVFAVATILRLSSLNCPIRVVAIIAAWWPKVTVLVCVDTTVVIEAVDVPVAIVVDVVPAARLEVAAMKGNNRVYVGS